MRYLIGALIVVILFCAGFAVGRHYEAVYFSDVYYEDACHMSDALRAYEDYLKDTTDGWNWRFESSAQAVNNFEERIGVYLQDVIMDGHKVVLEDYVWCY